MRLREGACAGILVLCAPATIAQAASTAQPAPSSSAQRAPTFGEADRDHDGRLKRSEIPHQLPMLRARFADFDVNHDGYLDPAEIIQYLANAREGRGLDAHRTSVGTPEVQHPLQLQSGHGIEHD